MPKASPNAAGAGAAIDGGEPNVNPCGALAAATAGAGDGDGAGAGAVENGFFGAAFDIGGYDEDAAGFGPGAATTDDDDDDDDDDGAVENGFFGATFDIGGYAEDAAGFGAGAGLAAALGDAAGTADPNVKPPDAAGLEAGAGAGDPKVKPPIPAGAAADLGAAAAADPNVKPPVAAAEGAAAAAAAGDPNVKPPDAGAATGAATPNVNLPADDDAWADFALASAASFSFPGRTVSHAGHEKCFSSMLLLIHVSHFHPVDLKASPQPLPTILETLFSFPPSFSLSSDASSSSSPMSESSSANSQDKYHDTNLLFAILLLSSTSFGINRP